MVTIPFWLILIFSEGLLVEAPVLNTIPDPVEPVLLPPDNSIVPPLFVAPPKSVKVPVEEAVFIVEVNTSPLTVAFPVTVAPLDVVSNFLLLS